MNEQSPYAIVVDTSVARAASQTQNPTSIHCRETLHTLDYDGYVLAMSEPVWEEWNRKVLGRVGPWNTYASRYAMAWYNSMQSRRRVCWVAISVNSLLKQQVLAQCH